MALPEAGLHGTPGVRKRTSVEVPVFGPVLLAAARSDGVRRFVSSTPVTRPVVNRFVAGERLDACMENVRSLTGRSLNVTIDNP